MTIYEKLDALKARIDAARPFEQPMLSELKSYYLIGLTWSSNALEGNTLTISETKVLLEDGLTVAGHPLREIYEAVGHGAAYDYMFGLAREPRITANDIKAMHRLFYKSIDEKQAGVWRDRSVVVTGSDYRFPAPEELDALMRELEIWMKTERNSLHPIAFAAMLHLKFVSIHPFVDGNGRVARLLTNLSLIQDGYMLAIVPPVLRAEYLAGIHAYQKSGNSSIFVQFMAERVYESEKEMIRLLNIE